MMEDILLFKTTSVSKEMLKKNEMTNMEEGGRLKKRQEQSPFREFSLFLLPHTCTEQKLSKISHQV